MRKPGILPKAVFFLLLLAPLLVYSQNSTADPSLLQARENIGKAQGAINFMGGQGLNTKRVMDLMDEAILAVEMGDYGMAFRASSDIIKFKDLAIELGTEIEETRLLLYTAEDIYLDVQDLQAYLNESEAELLISNYERSRNILDSIVESIEHEMEKTLLEINFTLFVLKTQAAEHEIRLNILEAASDEVNSALFSKDFRSIGSIKDKVDSLDRLVPKLIESKNSISSLKNMDFTVSRLVDMYEEAIVSIELGLFGRALDSLNQISYLHGQALKTDYGLKKAQSEISELSSRGLDASKAVALLDSARTNFQANNYEESGSLLGQVFEELEAIRTESLLFGVISKSELKFSMLKFIRNYWWIMLILIVILAVMTLISYHFLSLKLLELRINNLHKEKETIIELIKKVQTDYFKVKKLSKESYEIKVDKHQSRLIAIKQALPLLRSKLSRKTEEAPFLGKLFQKS